MSPAPHIDQLSTYLPFPHISIIESGILIIQFGWTYSSFTVEGSQTPILRTDILHVLYLYGPKKGARIVIS